MMEHVVGSGGRLEKSWGGHSCAGVYTGTQEDLMQKHQLIHIN